MIVDRDPLFPSGFREIPKSAGVESVRLPKQSPNLNAFAARFVRSIKHEGLDRMILFSAAMLCRVVEENMTHYHKERNHQGINGKIIRPQFDTAAIGPVSRRERVGGLLNFYCRETA